MDWMIGSTRSSRTVLLTNLYSGILTHTSFTIGSLIYLIIKKLEEGT